MPNQPSPIPLDLSGHREVPPSDVAPLVEKVAAEPEERALSTLTALLMNRALRLLRQGSRQEILAEALMLTRVLAIEAGRHLRQCRPEAFGGWTALGDLLSGAAQSTGRAAVPSILRSTQGRGQAILELLAGEGGPVPRSRIKNKLKLAEAHLSHLLADLEEASLIIRYRLQGGKEVLVELGPVGREVVSQSVLPPWLERLASAIAEIANGAPLDAEALARDLQEAGAPSRLAADRLAEAVARLAPAAAYRGASPRPESTNVLHFIHKVEKLQEDGVSRLQEMRTFEAMPARALFGAKAAS